MDGQSGSVWGGVRGTTVQWSHTCVAIGPFGSRRTRRSEGHLEGCRIGLAAEPDRDVPERRVATQWHPSLSVRGIRPGDREHGARGGEQPRGGDDNRPVSEYEGLPLRVLSIRI